MPSGALGAGRHGWSEIRMAIDTERRRVVFDRWGELTGVSASLIIALAEPFRQATRDELRTGALPFTETAELMSQTKCDGDETLRRRIMRCRNDDSGLARMPVSPAAFARRRDREQPVARLQAEPGSGQDRGSLGVVRGG